MLDLHKFNAFWWTTCKRISTGPMQCTVCILESYLLVYLLKFDTLRRITLRCRWLSCAHCESVLCTCTAVRRCTLVGRHSQAQEVVQIRLLCAVENNSRGKASSNLRNSCTAKALFGTDFAVRSLLGWKNCAKRVQEVVSVFIQINRT